MESKKTSKKSIKSVEQPSAESKPVKRASTKATVKAPTPSLSTSEPKNKSHRHSKPSAVAAAPHVDYEEIARLAYKYWEERSYAHGYAEEDWKRAEKALSATAGR